MTRPHVHVSVVLEDPEGILMVNEGKPDVYRRWNLPGGHVERGEVIASAGMREVREETGLQVQLTHCWVGSSRPVPFDS